MSVLNGKTILVTRPKGQGSTFLDELEKRGGEALILSATEVAVPEDTEPMDCALTHLAHYHWVVFTSTNGVRAARDRMLALGVNPDAMSGRKIAVVGPSTAGAVTEEWKAPDCMPDVFTSIYIADAMGDIGKQNVLLLRGDLATEALPNALAERGATVMDAIAYRLVKTEMSLIGDDKRVPDAIAITSGENAVAAIQALQSLGFEHWLRHVPIICMGPNTAEAVRRLGFRPSDVANPHSVEGLLAATERVLGGVVCAAT